ncbi:MAG TPA: HK97 family phage prohead protease [Caulobacteraceae bacterium]|jgi:HK97 family phage prohead protease|nr:HK97 family phage prohead protease [Caulobacteraceae bacterium]
MRRISFAANIRALGEGEVEAIISTGNLVEQDGLCLVPAGCELGDYLRNPICLWSHDPLVPIGRAVDVRVSGDSLRARICFAKPGISAKADEICGLVKNGIISGISIGFDFDPADAEPITPGRPQAGRRVRRWVLLEISFVSVPADPAALVTARSRALTATTSHRVIGLLALLGDAAEHAEDAQAAHEARDRPAVRQAHLRLHRRLSGAEKTCGALADQASRDEKAAVGGVDPRGLMNAEQIKLARRLTQLVDDALDHAGDAEAAHDGRDDSGVTRAHRQLRGCLDRALRSATALHLSDPNPSAIVQTSAGTVVDAGSSPSKEPGRAADPYRYDPGHPLSLGERVARAAAAHANAVWTAPRGDPDFAQRQADLRELAAKAGRR